jgi:hypothetical protein
MVGRASTLLEIFVLVPILVMSIASVLAAESPVYPPPTDDAFQERWPPAFVLQDYSLFFAK